MNTELANKITSMLQAIPAHAKWDIEIIGIQPVLEGLYIVYRNRENPIQGVARLIKYCEL